MLTSHSTLTPNSLE